MEKLMTPEERAEVEPELSGIHPASAELVLDAVRAEGMTRTVHTAAGPALASARAVAAVPAIVRRLLAVEAEYALMRTTLARVLHPYGAGDDYTLSDLVFALSQAGLSVQAELDELMAVGDAEARESLR